MFLRSTSASYEAGADQKRKTKHRMANISSVCSAYREQTAHQLLEARLSIRIWLTPKRSLLASSTWYNEIRAL
jgi:hypothetical protein